MALGAPDNLKVSMQTSVVLDQPLTWRHVAAVAEGAAFSLSEGARERIGAARLIVESLVAKRIRAYGVNTGVGALCDVVVEASQLRHLSRNIVMSHAVGVGNALGRCEVRAIMAAAVNNFAHGCSGVRLELVERLISHLTHDWIPEVPTAGSVGYLSHMAHIALPLIGEGHVRRGGDRRASADVLQAAQIGPLVLEAKEGLSLVNGTPCVTGLTALALLRTERLLNWADVISAMTFENLRGQLGAFDADALGFARLGGGFRRGRARAFDTRRQRHSGRERRAAYPGRLESAGHPSCSWRRSRIVCERGRRGGYGARGGH